MKDKQRERLVELFEQLEDPSSTCPRMGTGKACKGCKYLKGDNCDLTGRYVDYLLANNVLVLPYALDSKVWCLGQPCGGCECYNEPMTEEFIERCRKCDKWEIGECEFDYELIPEWGESVFPTRAKAEEALGKKLEEALKGGVQSDTEI